MSSTGKTPGNNNPSTFEQGLMARYPNNTKLINTKIPDEHGNTQALMYEDGQLLTPEKFSGVVYINETTFEIYSGTGPRKAGLFIIGKGTDWNCETPRQVINKASTVFWDILRRKFKEMEPACSCSYPRITDYLARNARESGYLFNLIQYHFLIVQQSSLDDTTGVATVNYTCRICNSEYEWKYKERGIDQIRMTKDRCLSKIGKEPSVNAPNYLDALFANVFCQKSYLYRNNLYESDLETLMEYLFGTLSPKSNRSD